MNVLGSVVLSAVFVSVTTVLGLPAHAAPSECDASAISIHLGQQLNVVRCYGDWAYVDAGGLGDAQSLLRLVDGRWTRYTGFPSSICRDQARMAGVPDGELSSFRPC